MSTKLNEKLAKTKLGIMIITHEAKLVGKIARKTGGCSAWMKN